MTEIVHLVGSILGRKLRIVSETRRRRPETSEVERLFAANRKAAELLRWQPRVSLLQGLQKTIEWFQSRRGRYKHHLYNV